MNDLKVEKSYGLSIGLGPLNFEISLPVEKWVKSLWGAFGKNIAQLSLGFIEWCLQRIYTDRLEDSDAFGAWGKSYIRYLRFLYGEDEIPQDVSIKDSITFTSIIICALAKFNELYTEEGQGKIATYLDDARNYILSRQDIRSGGFGLKVKTSRRDSRIAVDLRHTAYAIIGLSALHKNPEEIIKGIMNVSSQLSKIDFYSERAITLSVLHFLFSSNLTANRVTEIISDAPKWKIRIETELVNNFDSELQSWDMNKDPDDKSRIDNAIFVLLNLDEQNINSDRLKSICKSSVARMLTNDIIAINEKECGVRFVEGGNPDIGTTLEFLELVLKNSNLYKVDKKIIRQMITFVTNNFENGDCTQFTYGWQLASALVISSLQHEFEVSKKKLG